MKNYAMFVFGETLEVAIEAIPEEFQLKFYRIVKDYGLHGIEPELTGFEQATWVQMKTMIDNTMPKQNKSIIGKNGAPFGNKNATRNNLKQLDTTETTETTSNNSIQPKQLDTTETTSNNCPNDNDNDNDNDNVNENENENGACAPVFSLFQNLNPNSQTFETNFVKLQNTWNELKVGPPYKWLQTNIPPPEFSDIKRFLTNETDSVKIGIAAMRNYCAVLNAPDKFDPVGHKGYIRSSRF